MQPTLPQEETTQSKPFDPSTLKSGRTKGGAWRFVSKYIVHILSATVIFLGGINLNLNLKVSEMAALKSAMSKLKAKNKKLITQQKNIKKRLVSHRKAKTKQLIARAKEKIVSAPAKAVPLLGVATIVAMTTVDVNAFCGDIKDMNSVEKELYGEVEESEPSSQEFDEVCSMNVKEYLSPTLQAKYDESIQFIKTKTNASIEWIKEASDSSLNSMKSFFD